MTSSPRWFLTAFALILATPAWAQNPSTPGALELYPTLHCIGARLAYVGDDNGNASARIEWRRQGDASWTLGTSMTRITNRRWAASVLWLDPNTSYEVRAVIEDPDGGGAVTGAQRTRADAIPAPSGRTWWVATNGSDTAGGTSTAPLATIQAAVNAAQPGDEIRVRPGLYHQTVHPVRSGTPTAMFHLVADGPGVVIDGSDPAHLRRTDWRDDGDGVFSIPFTATARLVCADSLQRLYHHANVAALRADANGVTQGWTLEAGRMSVKLEDRSSPAGHVMHIARYENGVFFEGASYWRVSGFEVRYFGTGAAGAAVYLRSASSCILTDNHLHTIGGRGILMRVGSADNRIERNLVRDPRVGAWPWSATKAHEEEITGISNRGGRGNVIRSNTVAGWFDGMDITDGAADNEVGNDTDYIGNVVTAVGDDGIETDVIAGINVRLLSNRFERCYYGISVAPNYQGPEYIVYNSLINYTHGGFKFSGTSTGHTWICHNTVASVTSGTPAVWPTGQYSNMHFRNNVLVGAGMPAVNDDAGESQSGNDFDANLLHSNTGTLFRWRSVNYSALSALRTALGFEANGRSGDPRFTAAATGDFTLVAGSPAIDGALLMPGINDRYSGIAPDIGAFEFGSVGPDRTPPARITDLSVQH